MWGESIVNGVSLCNDLNIDLDPVVVDQLLYHASFQPQDSQMLSRNKMMIDFGHAVIKLLAGIYFYVDKRNRNAEDLNRSAQWKNIELGFYTEKQLEGYVYKSKGEINCKHPDTASKIIAHMYLSWGLLRTYDYLLPLIKKYSSTENTDYKTQLQEYAQKYKIPFSYKIIDVQGPGHELVHTCELTVGSNKVTASAAGKKKAEKAAAEEYIKKYHIRTTSQSNKQSTVGVRPPTVSENRALLLENCIDMIGLPQKIVPVAELNIAFTHRSTNVRQRKLEDNTALIVVGSLLLRVYAFEYMLSRYEEFENHAIDSLGVLLRTESYVGFIPKQWIKALNAEKMIFAQNDSALDHIRTDLYASVQGVLISNAIRDYSEYLAEVSRENARACLSYSHRHKVHDYRSVLQEIAQKHNIWVNVTCKERAALPDISYVFCATIECMTEEWELLTTAYGRSVKQATNAAAKKMIASFLPYFSDDAEDVEKISISMDPEEWKQETKKLEIAKAKNDLTSLGEISFDNTDSILYIFKGTVSFRKNKHLISTVTGIVEGLRGKIKINVNYCADCNIYFLDYHQYCYYRELYGALLGNFVMLEHSGYGFGYDNMASESILRICGYTVNQNDNLSESERRHILKYLMDKGIVAKYRIIEYLQFFINNALCRPNMSTARTRWESDLNWVRAYQVN